MSPILVRPVREQLEHDRIIRQLHAKHRRKYEVGINPGREENAPVGSGPTALFPDLVLMGLDRAHRLQAVIEVETGESVNHLEALAQWAHFGRLRAPFHLYVPSGMVEVARQLCDDNQIRVGEIWSYHMVGEELRFTLVHRSREAVPAPPRDRGPAVRPAAAAKRSPKPVARKVATTPADRKKPASRAFKPSRLVKSARAKTTKKPKRK